MSIGRAMPGTEFELRRGEFLLIRGGKAQNDEPRPIPNDCKIRFLDESQQLRPILVFDLFLAGREAIYSNGIFHLLGGELFQFRATWLDQGIRLAISK